MNWMLFSGQLFPLFEMCFFLISAQLHRKLANIEKRNEETEYLNNLTVSYLQNQIYDLTEQGKYELS